MAYYISPRFLDKLAIHITKNYLSLPDVRVPVILGVHGRKGEGKTFQCELVYERMGVEVVAISGGELESPDAGDPARLIRLRYREAAELVRVRGVMAVLMINDLDAGAGRFDALTQYTVNTQLVNNTLMNIADNPTNVQLPGSYDDQPIRRVPIIATGNDFSTLYEPLVRDGRMEKFYWMPDRSDRIGIVAGIFEPDQLGTAAIEQLVDTFSQQAVDFFGALRARIYDEQVRDFIQSVGLDKVSQRVVNSETSPTFTRPTFTLSHLIEVGQQMVIEQQWLQEMRLGDQYNRALREKNDGPRPAPRGPGATSFPGDQHTPEPSPPSPPEPAPDLEPSGPTPKSFYRAYGAPPAYPSSSPQGATLDNGNGQPNPTSTPLSPEIITQIQTLLHQGHRIGIEHVDQRRFRTTAWQSCPSVQTSNPNEVVLALAQCLTTHPQDYVRLIGIDTANKRRVWEQIIQRPR
ncbi:ribulose bisphosphate carboxylase small subunit [Leptolyngbya sp. PCC 6406]|uniref:ribulose bisphosphate carboxylase small subunit n=1 Tax=Leptolyngbya sp. PCC 6406 TaxID=1173264 RepID=UPI0002ACF8A4|nr:ribulose bisphosphate carboxylase small subunit [Leptolyngbya sp. PCC 6406]